MNLIHILVCLKCTKDNQRVFNKPILEDSHPKAVSYAQWTADIFNQCNGGSPLVWKKYKSGRHFAKSDLFKFVIYFESVEERQ